MRAGLGTAASLHAKYVFHSSAEPAAVAAWPLYCHPAAQLQLNETLPNSKLFRSNAHPAAQHFPPPCVHAPPTAPAASAAPGLCLRTSPLSVAPALARPHLTPWSAPVDFAAVSNPWFAVEHVGSRQCFAVSVAQKLQ